MITLYIIGYGKGTIQKLNNILWSIKIILLVKKHIYQSTVKPITTYGDGVLQTNTEKQTETSGNRN